MIAPTPNVVEPDLVEPAPHVVEPTLHAGDSSACGPNLAPAPHMADNSRVCAGALADFRARATWVVGGFRYQGVDGRADAAANFDASPRLGAASLPSGGGGSSDASGGALSHTALLRSDGRAVDSSNLGWIGRLWDGSDQVWGEREAFGLDGVGTGLIKSRFGFGVGPLELGADQIRGWLDPVCGR